ncbi:energy transducer TonB [Rhodoflexus sp.]
MAAKLIWLIFLLVCTMHLAAAQGTKKVFNTAHMPKFSETYFVMRDNDTLKHGLYQKISYREHNKGEVLEQGYYKNGLREGEWQLLQAKGKYEEGQKVGVWEYYTYEKPRKIEQRYDHSLRKVVEYDYSKVPYPCFLLSEPDSATNTPPDTAAIFIGGGAGFLQQTADQIRYPAQALKKQVSGQVVVAVRIDEEGNMQPNYYRIVQGIGAGCDEEALNVVKGMTHTHLFVPARHNGKNVPVEMHLRFAFKLKRSLNWSEY